MATRGAPTQVRVETNHSMHTSTTPPPQPNPSPHPTHPSPILTITFGQHVFPHCCNGFASDYFGANARLHNGVKKGRQKWAEVAKVAKVAKGWNTWVRSLRLHVSRDLLTALFITAFCRRKGIRDSNQSCTTTECKAPNHISLLLRL